LFRFGEASGSLPNNPLKISQFGIQLTLNSL